MKNTIPDDAENDGGLALRHACALLQRLGASGQPRPQGIHPALAWRRAGLIALTGRPDRPGLVCPVPLTSAADGALAALRALAPEADLPLSGAALLGERARLIGLTRQGATSPNGTCRLLRSRDGHIALNLPRTEDWDLMSALFESEAGDWEAVARLVKLRETDELIARGAAMGIAIVADRARFTPAAPFFIERFGSPRPTVGKHPLVVDLSSLWAGPLAGSLLRDAGAHVVKVESLRRPDGARYGNAQFFNLMNAGKECIAFDFIDAGDLSRLRDLIRSADIVIEASRPRALEQLGIRAGEIAASGTTWLSITAHGRAGEAAGRIGFGDDAAIAGGLGVAMRKAWGKSLFAGDAIADPLAGIIAALGGWSGWLGGGGCLISVALADVVAHARELYTADAQQLRAWQKIALEDDATLYPMRESPVTEVVGKIWTGC